MMNKAKQASIFQQLFILSALVLSISGTQANQRQTSQPNILIFLADDLGYADPGYRGSGIDTPNLDRLAAEGVDLQRFYVAPICSPTRAALMTGRNPMRLGVAYGVLLPWDSGGVHTEETFMPELFRDAGYQTALFGKWHLGHAQQGYHPNARGFEHFYGHLHTEVGMYPPFQILGGKDFQENGVSIDEQGYETDLLAERASEWIQNRDPDKPFFLYLPFLAPHEPLAAPEALVEKYQHLEDTRGPARSPSDNISRMTKLSGAKSRRPLYAAVVDAMDQGIGTVLNTLDKEGIADNTIVLFFSDNGATRVYGRGGGDNAPLRGGKAETYEGGIRVVALMKWSEQLPAGKAHSELMSVMDVLPTLAAAAGIEPRTRYALDGVNQLPALIKGQKVAQKESLLFASEIPRYGSFNYALIEDDWKLVQFVEQDPLETRISNELYRIDRDPGEHHNLAKQEPLRVAAMAKEVLRWRSLYPLNGTRARISSPPGWHPPKDWAHYPHKTETLLPQPATSMAPDARSEYLLDRLMDERGRLIYNCEPARWRGGLCPLLKK